MSDYTTAIQRLTLWARKHADNQNQTMRIFIGDLTILLLGAKDFDSTSGKLADALAEVRRLRVGFQSISDILEEPNGSVLEQPWSIRAEAQAILAASRERLAIDEDEQGAVPPKPEPPEVEYVREDRSEPDDTRCG